MEIKQIDGNLLDSNAELIMHQVNCQGKMNSGVAKVIREKWPVVYQSYLKLIGEKIYASEKGFSLLGLVQPVTVSDTQKVLNLFGQEKYGYDGKQYTSYKAIETCFRKVASYCTENGYKTVAMPYKMSCDRGGADWDTIMNLLTESFKNTDVTIEIWKIN